MPSYWDALNLALASDGDGAQRRAVLEAAAWAPAPTTRVAYTAANRVLVIADAATAAAVARRLPDKILTYAAIPAPQSGPGAAADSYHCAGLAVDGYLGRFRATIADGDNAGAGAGAGDGDGDNDGADSAARNLADLFDIPSGFFDQVLDCGDAPRIAAAVKPPGYYYAGADADAQAAAIAAIPEHIGEFEKPKYFDYDAAICAHGRSGIGGCTRCIDACPTAAIVSHGESVEVNPHLCQGHGTCAAACPTAAIQYTYPRAAEQVELLRALLKSLREHNANRGVTVLIFGDENGRAAVESCAAELPGHILPFMVEEIGAAGLDLIASALAYGANRVCLYAPPGVPAQARDSLHRDLGIIDAVLQQTGCASRYRAEIIDDLNALDGDGDSDGDGDGDGVVIDAVATFAPAGGKRTVIRAALSFFAEVGSCAPEAAALPAGSLFGNLSIDVDACTLCMACASVCPAAALQAGGDTPALKFIESNCVQCGICARACPESALELESRLHFDARFTSTPRELKVEAPFCCIKCAKPFATRAMIARMTCKLKDHRMFAAPEALRRLQMCEDCRVKDLFDG